MCLHSPKKLYTVITQIPLENAEYWASFHELPDSAEDIFSLMTIKDIRSMIDSHVVNLNSLVMETCARIFRFVEAPDVPDQASVKQVMNCIRILTRLLPVIFELDAPEIEAQLFWDSNDKLAGPLARRLVGSIYSLLFFRG